MEFRKFISEMFDSPTTLKWQQPLIDDGQPKKVYFTAGSYSYFISFTGPQSKSPNPEYLGEFNNKNEYSYVVGFDVERNSKGQPIKNTLYNKLLKFKDDETQNKLFTRISLGNENEVFSNVKAATEEFIKKIKPAILTWKVYDPELGRLYKKIILRYMPKEYKLMPNPYGGTRLIRKNIIDALQQKENQPLYSH